MADKDRPFLKDLFCAILNSSEEKVNSFRADYKKAYKEFNKYFPNICKLFLHFNKEDSYMGQIIAREYESQIVYNIQNRLKNNSETKDFQTVIIHDGIEIRGKNLSEIAIEAIWNEVEGELSPYKYLFVELKRLISEEEKFKKISRDGEVEEKQTDTKDIDKSHLITAEVLDKSLGRQIRACYAKEKWAEMRALKRMKEENRKKLSEFFENEK